jgi:uncharacterized protein YjiS (DUF1127 family)
MNIPLPTMPAARASAIAFNALRALVSAADTWLAARKRGARDFAELSTMSERELHDIGISRASQHAIAYEGLLRDWPL